jgi:subtilisin-like proprotein convertase family protein
MFWSLTNSRPRRKAARPAPRRAALGVESLEERDVPAGFFVTGVGNATNPAEPFARLYDASAPGDSSNVVGPGNINAFPGFAGSVRVAVGDVNGDGTDDIICAQGSGPGSGSQVRIFDGAAALFTNTATQIASFFVYSNAAGATQTPGFGGGVFVAAADFNGDGFDELVTSPGAGARGHVKVFNFNNGGGTFLGNNPELRTSFFAYTDFAGEIRVTTLTRTIGGVQTAFLVTASGAGSSQCDVRLYGNAFNIGQVADLTFVPPAVQFFPFPGFAGGVSVAAGDIDNNGDDELFVSQNAGPSIVRVFDIVSVLASGSSTPAPAREFQPFPGFLGEVRLGAADVDGDGQVEVLTSTGASPGAGGSHIKAWNVSGTPTELRSFFAYQGYVGGVFLSTNDFTWTQQFTSTDTPVDIPDNGLLLPRSSIAVNPRTITDTALTPKSVEVDLNITALTGNFNQDLDVVLQAPDGTQLILFNDVNNGGAGFNVTLSDDAATAIEAAAAGAPTTGTFRPETPASFAATFGNTLVAGNWTLLIQDDTATGTFRLNSWTIRFVF